MKKTIRACVGSLSLSVFLFAQTQSAPSNAPAAATPAQRDECPKCTPEEKQAAGLIKQGRELQSQGKLDEAIGLFKKAVAAAPEYFSVHTALGAALDVKGDYQDARQHLQRAIDLAKSVEQKVSALRSMSFSYAFECKLPEVEKYERQAEQLQINDKKDTDAAGTLNELARIQLECGDVSHAYDTYKEGFGLAEKAVTKPEDEDLWEFRWEHAQARVDARRGLKDEAQKHEAAAKAIFEKNTLPAAQGVFVPYLTGYVAFYAGDYKAALGDLLKADQRDPFILALIAQTYERLNDKVQAKEYWTKVLGFYSHNPTNAYARPLAKKAVGE